LYNGAYRIPRLLSRIRLLPPALCAPLPSSFPRPSLPYTGSLLTPPRDGIPCSSPPLPDRGRVEHSAPPALVECSGDRLGGASRLGSPWQPPRWGVCAIH